MRRAWAAVLPLAMLVLLGSTGPSRAHVVDRSVGGTELVQTIEAGASPSAASAPGPVKSATAPGPPLIHAWVSLLALAFAGSLLRLPGSRRAFVVLLVASLAVLTFEGGVHSVHHLGDEDAGARCAVASASSNLTGASANPVELTAPVEVEAAGLLPGWGRLSPHPTRLAQGRAPPFLA